MASAAELSMKGSTAVFGGHGMPGQSEGATIDGFSHLVFEVADLDRSERFALPKGEMPMPLED